MTLVYDFDIFDVMPSSGEDEADLHRFLTDAGFEKTRQPSVALFRDWRTAEALRRAPDPLRNYFLASGFGLNTFQSGAPANRYPASDEAARLEVIERLTANAPRFALHSVPPADMTEDAFSLPQFLLHLSEATPIAMLANDLAMDATSIPISKNHQRVADVGRAIASEVLSGMTARFLKGVPRLGQFRRS